jgi:hypothetical protein
LEIELMGSVGTRPVLIAGGGIGGLAAALGLAQKGIPSILLEKAAALGEIGAGIQLGPNAFHAFDYLGVGEAARGMAVYIDQLRLMDALSAEEITHVDLRDAFRSRFGNPYGVVHRGDLHGVFLRACQEHDLIELRVSSEVTGYDQDGSSMACGRISVNQSPPTGRHGFPVTPLTVRLFRSRRCPRICAGTQRRCGRGRSATSFITRCRAGRCSISSSPITTTRRSRSQAKRYPTRKS